DPGRGVLGDHARHAPDAYQGARHRAGPDHPDPDPDGRGRHQDPDPPAGRDELLVPVLHAQVAAAGQAAGQAPAEVPTAPRVTLVSLPFSSVSPAPRPRPAVGRNVMKPLIQCFLVFRGFGVCGAGASWRAPVTPDPARPRPRTACPYSMNAAFMQFQ